MAVVGAGGLRDPDKDAAFPAACAGFRLSGPNPDKDVNFLVHLSGFRPPGLIPTKT